jgi:alpha-amylase
MNLYFDLARGGTLFEWDWRAKMFNLVSTMTRRPEGYHRMLSTVKRQTAEGVKTIHDIVQLKETGLDQVLFYDWYRRVSLIDHFLDPAVSLDEFYRAQYAERGDFVDQPYRHDVAAVDDEWLVNLNREGHVWQNSAFLPLRLEKRVHIRGGCLTLAIIYVLTNTSDRPVQSIFGVEFNFGLLAGHSPDAYYRIPGVVLDDPHLDSKGELASVTELVLVYQGLGLEIDLAFSRPTKLWRFPIETISSSESGFERVYQSSCLLPHWNLNLAPGETWQVELRFTLREPSP